MGELQYVARTPGSTDDYTDAHKAELLPSSSLGEADMYDDPDRAQRYRRMSGPLISRRVHTNDLLAGSMMVAMHQLNFLLSKVKAGEKLDPAEERLSHKLVEDITRLTREEREQRKFEKLEEMPQEEFGELFREAALVLGITEGEGDADDR